MFSRNSVALIVARKNLRKQNTQRALNRATRTGVEALERRTLLSASLDPSFGSGGIVKGPGVESYDVIVQSDGKLLVADDKGLIRYNANGSIDTSFGGGDGIVELRELNSGEGVDRAKIAVTADGKIIAAGSDHQTGLVVERYNADGSRDLTFGDYSRAKPSSGAGFWDVADVDIVGGGKILIGGSNNPRPFLNDFSITRLNPDGTPDTTFGGGDGRIDRSIRAYDDLDGLLVQRDGKIIAFGNSATAIGTPIPEPDQWAASLFRLHGDGSLDTSFGAVGKTERIDDWRLVDAELQSTGKIVLLTDSGREVRRLESNGTIDLSFGEDGSAGIGVSTNTSFSLIEGSDLLVRADDSILMAGHTIDRVMPGEEFQSGNAAVGKLLANGEQDGSFGGGFLNIDFGGNRDDINALALQGERIIGAGVTGDSDGIHTNALARIIESGGGGTGGGTGLKGQYFNNMDFTAPVFTRTDTNVNFNWGTGSPDPRIEPDTFSVRWTGFVQAPTTGRYTFYTTTDDGVRLWVNNQLLIDKMVPQSPTEYSASIDLNAGEKYQIRMDYFERSGGAQAKLQWSGPGITKQRIPQSALFSEGTSTGDTQPPSAVPNFQAFQTTNTDVGLRWDAASDNVGVTGYEVWQGDSAHITFPSDRRAASWSVGGPGTYVFNIRAVDAAGNKGPIESRTVTMVNDSAGNGLKGEYFNNMDFTSLALTRRDDTVNFNWGTGSPDPSISPDTFSVRWSGQIQVPTTGRYTFYTTSDDGARLTINGQRIIDKLVPQATTEWSGSIDLVAGQKYTISMEYFERFGGALAKLQWSGPGISKQVVPRSQLFS